MNGSLNIMADFQRMHICTLQKFPKNFMGFPIKVGTVGIDPYLTMTENYTHSVGRIPYKLTGLSVELLKLVCEKMNLTTVFLVPSPKMELDSYAKEFTELDKGLSNVLTGVIPLIPLVLTPSFDVTVPYTHIKVKMLVPCPKTIPGTEKLMTTFSLSVWLTIGLVLLLTTAVFWLFFIIFIDMLHYIILSNTTCYLH